MESDFKIIMSSDFEYEDLCAEIYYKDEFVAIVSQENGFENLQIEISPNKKKDNWVFKFSDFEKILYAVKQALWDMRKMHEG